MHKSPFASHRWGDEMGGIRQTPEPADMLIHRRIRSLQVYGRPCCLCALRLMNVVKATACLFGWSRAGLSNHENT